MCRWLSLTWLVYLPLTLTGCFDLPERSAYPLPQQEPLNWEKLKDSQGAVELKILDTGDVKVPVSGVLDGYQTWPGDDADKGRESRWVSVFSFWLKHPTLGDVLIDTGLDDRFAAGGQGSYKGFLAPHIVEDSRQRSGQDIASQLRLNDIRPSLVLLTHIHGDHTSGLPAISEKPRIVAAKDESYHYYPAIMYNDHFDGVAQVEEIDLEAGHEMGPFQRVVDLFGDQSVLAIAAPGHTHGNLSYLINTTEGWVLLTGDASHTRWGFENSVPPGWSEDSDHARTTLQQLREFSAANHEVRVILGHEV